jgi:hypothetical protein
MSRQAIFDFFYSRQTVVGGGSGRKAKCKMARNVVSFESKSTLEKSVVDSPDLLAYYIKLRDRSDKLGAPPRPGGNA